MQLTRPSQLIRVARRFVSYAIKLVGITPTAFFLSQSIQLMGRLLNRFIACEFGIGCFGKTSCETRLMNDDEDVEPDPDLRLKVATPLGEPIFRAAPGTSQYRSLRENMLCL